MWYGPSKLNHNGLIERTFSFQDIFRIDENPPAVVCSRGFLPSQDFTGISQMLLGDKVLIAAEKLKGVRRYSSINRGRGYLYKISSSHIKGVSLADNFLNNRRGLAKFLDVSESEISEKINLAEYTGGAMYLSEVHIDIESFNVSDIHWINNVEINSYPPLKKGSWNNYI